MSKIRSNVKDMETRHALQRIDTMLSKMHDALDTFAITNVTTDRAYDADATSTAELADALGTLISDLKSALT